MNIFIKKNYLLVAIWFGLATIYPMDGHDDEDLEISVSIKSKNAHIERTFNCNGADLIIRSENGICEYNRQKLIRQIRYADLIAEELLKGKPKGEKVIDCSEPMKSEKRKKGSKKQLHDSAPSAHDNTDCPPKPSAGSTPSNPFGYTLAISIGAVALVAIHWFKWFSNKAVK